MNRLLLGAVGILFFVLQPVWAADQSIEIADITDESRGGLTHLFNLDYEEALISFRKLEEKYTDHPGPPLYEAIVIWQRELFRRRDLRLDRFVSPGYFTESVEVKMPQRESEIFFENLEKSMRLSQNVLERDPDHVIAKYFLGSAEGVLAFFELTIRHDKTNAFDHGKKAYELHREVIEADPNFYDAYLTVGIYEYIADNLPWYIKWLAVIAGFSGDEDKGLEYLRLSATKSTYANDDAQVILMVLLVREEKYEEALEVAVELHREYPKNFLLHLNRAQILERLDRSEGALQEYERVLQFAEAGKPNYDRVGLPSLRFRVAEEAFKLGHTEPAANHFSRLLKEKGIEEREMALSHLRMGQLYDLRGERERAKKHYRELLENPGFSAWHDSAEEYLERPFRW